MITVLTACDETVSGEKIHTIKLRVDGERVSVRELITQRVHQEADKFNLERPVCFRALVQPAGAQQTSNGFRLAEHRDMDWQQQAAAACEGFSKRMISVLVDGREMLDLDNEIAINDNTNVTFVTFMPVIAG